MQKIEGVYVNHACLVNSLKPGGAPLTADAWAWVDSRDETTSQAKVRWAVFSSTLNGPTLEGKGIPTVSHVGPYVPPDVAELCQLAGYAKAANPLLAAGADAATVREILLSDRRDEIMSAIASGKVDASYALQTFRAANSPLVLAATQLEAETKQPTFGTN